MTGLEAIKTSLELSSGMSAVKNKTHSYSALIIFTLNNKVQNEQIRYIPLTTEGWQGGGGRIVRNLPKEQRKGL